MASPTTGWLQKFLISGLEGEFGFSALNLVFAGYSNFYD
jgi:hypothetical protein